MNNFNTKLIGMSEQKQPVFSHRLFGNIVGVVLLAVAFSLVGNSQVNAAASFTSEQVCNSQANRTSYAFGCKSKG